MYPIPYRNIDPWVLLRAVAGDLEAFRLMARTFVETAPPMLTQLQRALAEGAPDPVARASHALRGSTMLVGAVALSAVLRQLELAARCGEPLATPGAAVLPLFAAVLAEVERSIVEFDGRDGAPKS